jgi:FtsP/CotA-like multicopper oxidase with cupredoxin domain
MTHLTRRAALLTAGAAGAGLLAACRSGTGPSAASPAAPGLSAAPEFVGPGSMAVRAAETARHLPGGRRTRVTLTAQAGRVDLGGRTVRTWSYGGQVPAPEIRVRPGDTVAAVLENRLPAPTTVHWHGLELFYPMDGVPVLTQRPAAPGSRFGYEFTVPHQPGTYWFHPHVGVQLDRGLYGPLIIEDPAEPLSYDHDWTFILDDWIDGVTATPDQVLATLRQGMSSMSGAPATGTSTAPAAPSMSGMEMPGGSPGRAAARGTRLAGATSVLLGGDAGDVRYPFYVINGRMASAPRTVTARPGQRARIRLINAGGDTAFRVALGGHRLQVVHADGYPVQPAGTDAVLVGMGERYDVIVTLGDGVFPLVASAEGKNGSALALIRTGPGRPPRPGIRPRELGGHVLDAAELRSAEGARLAPRAPDRIISMTLNGGMSRYDWAIGGRSYQPAEIGYAVRQGERVRLTYVNATAMWHPMHLHGHSFALRDGAGARKDTVIVLPRQSVTVQFDAANPGRWMTHCHNAYHAEAGMMTALGYTI